MSYFNDEGDEVEGVLSPEEAKALQEKAAAAEAAALKVAEYEAQLKEKEEELAKLSKKDFDYGRLRDKTKAELDEMRQKLSEKDKMLFDIGVRQEMKEKAEFEEARKEILS